MASGGSSMIDPEKGQGHVRSFSSSTENTDDESAKPEPLPLPGKRYGRLLRHCRHTFLNVYRRLFSVLFMLNLAGLGCLLGHRYTSHFNDLKFEEHLSTGASANVFVALMIRQDYVVNGLYKATWLIPTAAPLRLRRVLCKVYELGGVHSGAAVSSVMWLAILTVVQTIALARRQSNVALIVPLYALFIILVLLCITAYPRFRFQSHNTFEQVHRWGGWFAVALFWLELCLTAWNLHSTNMGLTLIQFPAFWLLLVTSLHIIAPWLRLHKLHIRAEKLSDHATRLHFTEPIPNFVGLRITESPLSEWHSFAAIPSRTPGGGGSVLVSNAGDWTKRTIQNPKPYYWVKGIPVTGVLCMARTFKKVVVVTTGSGIGPVLAVVQDLNRSSCRVIWSTPSPLRTYGQEIVDAVMHVDPNAMIMDSRAKKERPDLVKLAWDMYMESGAEAVFVISNPKVTRKVVYGLESRGVPAFGPVWDS